jgi:hypothetical protein
VQERKISRNAHRHGQFAVQLRYTGDLGVVHPGRANGAVHVRIGGSKGEIAGDGESASRRKRPKGLRVASQHLTLNRTSWHCQC